MPYKGVILVNLATFAWATNILIGRALRDEVGPFVLTAGRYLVAAGVFVLLLKRQPPAEKSLGKDLLPLLGMAATGIMAFAPILYFGLKFTTAVNGTLINGIGPLLTAVFAALLIGEPFNRRQLGGALLALLGVGVLISKGSWTVLREARWNPGDLWILLAVMFWALYSVAGRKVMRNRSALSATALSMLLGLPPLLALAGYEIATTPPQWGPKLALALLYLGIVPAGIGFFAWNQGVKLLGAGGAMVFYNTLPLYGALLGILLLGEPITLPHLIGGGCILGGGWLATRQGSSQGTPASQPQPRDPRVTSAREEN